MCRLFLRYDHGSVSEYLTPACAAKWHTASNRSSEKRAKTRSWSTTSSRRNRRLESFASTTPVPSLPVSVVTTPQFPQAVELQLHVVVLVEIVDAEHLVPLIDQPPGQMIANEPGDTGNEDLHRGYVPALAPTRGATAACKPAALSCMAGARSGPLSTACILKAIDRPHPPIRPIFPRNFNPARDRRLLRWTAHPQGATGGTWLTRLDDAASLARYCRASSACDDPIRP